VYECYAIDTCVRKNSPLPSVIRKFFTSDILASTAIRNSPIHVVTVHRALDIQGTDAGRREAIRDILAGGGFTRCQ
jgi:hypothetical protein